ncbi:MAG: PTS sugar transporter subunit IIA [Acidithiobacillus sp.]|nr:PTS sugar transporter subunit IIA [Acidithiobacillus sp.]
MTHSAEIVLLTHAGLGTAFLGVLRHIFGELPPDVSALEADPDDSDSLRTRLAQRMASARAEKRPLLILCDLPGASPANAIPKTLDPQWVEVIYGLNLPMLLRALSRRQDWQDLGASVREGGRLAIDWQPFS